MNTLSYGFSRTCSAEIPQRINKNVCTIDYIGNFTQCANMVRIGWLGAAPQIGEI
jgi:hypothetical protein